MALTPLKPLQPPKLKPFNPLGGTTYPKASFVTAATPKPLAYSPPAEEPYTPQLQNMLNSGQLPWTPSLSSLGYTPPASTRAQRPSQPDYGSLIAGDWEVQDAEAAMASQMARARGDFQSGLRQQLIDLGIGDTSKLGSLGKYIDANTIKAAVANKYSQTAQIAQQEARQGAMSNASLAARGILNSGQTTKNATDIASAAEGGRYSALRDFLSGGAQGLTGLGDMEFQLSQGVAAARSAAAARAAAQYPMGNPDLIYPNDSGYYGGLRQTREPGTPAQNAANAGVSRSTMSQQQFLRKNPGGNYYNYLRAWNRQYGNPNWGK